MGNKLPANAANTGHIQIDYNNRTGSWMQYWSVVIGEYTQNLIDESLKNELISEFKTRIVNKKKLNYRNKELTNFDSLINIQIQDLIEPCNLGTIHYTFNELKVKRLGSAAYSKPSCDTLNTWIPTLFRLNKNTKKYEIINDIVDINREPKNERLYKIIETIFNRMVPNIQKCLDSYPLQQEQYSTPEWNRKVENDAAFSKEVSALKATKLLDEYAVIIKMTDYQFMDETTASYGGGNFHSEGFETEYIKCAALYYFDVSPNVEGGNLVFQDPSYRHFGGSDNDPEIEIVDNMAVCFTNVKPYKHKVNKMAIKQGSKTSTNGCYDKDGKCIFGTRKLLGFFVVDPDRMNIVKTTQNMMVNFEYKIGFMIKSWMRSMKSNNVIQENDDIVNIIQRFVCGDMEFIKAKCDTYRAQRYNFGRRTEEYEDNLVNEKREAMRGVCD